MADKNLKGLSLTAPEPVKETSAEIDMTNINESDQVPESQFISETNISLVSISEEDNAESEPNEIVQTQLTQDSYLKELTCAQRSPIAHSIELSDNGRTSPSNFLQNISFPTNLENINSEVAPRKLPLPPTNPTLESLGKKNVILIQFNTSSKNILTNPMLINQLIKNSLFNSLNIQDIRTNFKKNLIAIESRTSFTENQIITLTSLKKLGEHEINCYVPNSDLFIYGVIGPISTDINLCLLYTSPSPRDKRQSRMPSSA